MTIMAEKALFTSRPRYEILDGLRGVAALVVVGFHMFETYRTSLADQIQYNIYLLDKIMDHYRALMKKSGEIGKRLLDATEDLAVISTQVASTSADQSSDVKEILSTMEDSNALSQNIANRISEVTKGTDSTKYAAVSSAMTEI